MQLPSSKESGLCTAAALTAFPQTWEPALLLTISIGSASMYKGCFLRRCFWHIVITALAQHAQHHIDPHPVDWSF